jgi:hypothetical protein
MINPVNTDPVSFTFSGCYNDLPFCSTERLTFIDNPAEKGQLILTAPYLVSFGQLDQTYSGLKRNVCQIKPDYIVAQKSQ